MRLHAKKWIVKSFNSLFSSPKMSLILITNEEVRTERKVPNTCRLKSVIPSCSSLWFWAGKEYFLAEAYGRKREETRAAEVAQWIAADGFSLSWRMSVWSQEIQDTNYRSRMLRRRRRKIVLFTWLK
jgi:hypothetical protein